MRELGRPGGTIAIGFLWFLHLLRRSTFQESPWPARPKHSIYDMAPQNVFLIFSHSCMCLRCERSSLKELDRTDGSFACCRLGLSHHKLQVVNDMILFLHVHFVEASEMASMRFASNDAGMQRRHWLVKLCAFLTALFGPARQLQVRSSEGEINRRSNDITDEWPSESRLSPAFSWC